MKKSKCFPFHEEIEQLILIGKTNPEIAEEIGVSKATICVYVQRVLNGNPNYLKKKRKHAHLHKEVLTYYLKHTFKETADKFSLTKSELKSCFTCAYRIKELGHLRKDNRRRDSWSAKELRFLLRWSGVISRSEINRHLKRGKGDIVIKEKLQKLGLCSKNVNGLTESQFRKLFKKTSEFYLETSAGSPAGLGFSKSHFKIIPWCHIEEMIDSKHIEALESIEIYIKTMAKFQIWVHGDNYWRSLTSIPNFK